MTDFEKAAAKILGSQDSRKLNNRLKDVQELASTRDGAAVQAMLDSQGQSILNAVQNGDTEAMRNALGQIMSTDAGARLIGELSKLIE